ncbi:type III-B CRISPR module RAMP protein Cmr1 [Sorangium sp. So ce513]|uniref:type III-B CRISPR module RAMP protein Cmr1 n=1 Tax=Sorangium sp. So ce513 TaxID=3133315 RepID=UPI003F618A04
MSPFYKLACEFEVLTPLFLGGASQAAELRVPSIKGVMRFWYRALDPEFKKREPVFFGSGGGNDARQSLLRLRCPPGGWSQQEHMRWRDARPEQYNQGSKQQTKNGLTYLGFPFSLPGNEGRTALRPGARFSLDVSWHRRGPDSPPPLRVALASVWALGHFGSLGMRSRRGFGALALTGWRLQDGDGRTVSEADVEALPLLHGTAGTAEWESGARRGLDVIRGWFGAFDAGGADKTRRRHPHFGPRADFAVVAGTARRDDWRGAVRALGDALQAARQRTPPDYGDVKQHVLFEAHQGGLRIQRAPARATFGLPLTFRYGSVLKGKPVTFTPVGGERHGSSLLLRPVLVGNSLSSLFLRLDGDVPGIDTPVGLRGSGRSLEPATQNAMDELIRKMKGKVAP